MTPVAGISAETQENRGDTDNMDTDITASKPSNEMEAGDATGCLKPIHTQLLKIMKCATQQPSPSFAQKIP
jgi:hypothetical protein